MSPLIKFGLVLCVILVTVGMSSARGRVNRLLRRHKRNIEWGPDIAGPYCATRPDGCCPGRIDECSVPILDTLCYCDMFCNRTRGDCCPDFFSFCHGQGRTTPAPFRGACEHRDTPYAPNAKLKINCRECTCARDERSKTGYDWRCGSDVCLIRETIINSVNGGNYGWDASNYSVFWGMTLKEGMRYRLGTNKPNNLVAGMNPIIIDQTERLPQSFDARNTWPNLIQDVRDQGNCASSWAFSTAALAADRLAIESRGRATDTLSPQNLLSCNNHGQRGCEGGSLDRAWWFFRKYGVTTEDCYPYRSGITSSISRCEVSRGQTGGRCPSGIPFTVESVFHSTPPYRISMSERDIMTEIMTNGPVQATFKVEEDFYMYTSGVYSYSRVVADSLRNEDDRRQYHSVRIIGWGVERSGGRSLKYWLCVNSWGTAWGERGYFRIARGTNECDIESFVLGVWAKVQGDIELRDVIRKFQLERQRVLFNGRSRGRRRRHLRKRRRHHRKHH